MTARRRFEVSSYGVDETRQLSGTSPYGGSAWLGLRVPTLSTASLTPPGRARGNFRYLFNGAAFSVGAGSRARIIGYRQYHEIGFLVPVDPRDRIAGGVRAITLPVTTPGWAFPDATVSWHFRVLGDPNAQGLPLFTPAPQNGQNLAKGFKMGPALLYQTITLPAGDPYYVDLTAYTPPNGGQPFGRPLTDHPQSSTILGLATDWRTPDAWGSLDVEVRGPETVAAFISVAQTDPSSYPALPFTPANAGVGITPEDAFLANALAASGAAIQWRVGVSMIVETDSLESEVRTIVGNERVVG
jgi:hypothetical protein